MNYLNIEIKFLTSEEFIGCEPTDRATWLCLMRYCAQQENGGVVEDCAEWGERKWQQICGVTKIEIDRKCKLWTSENGILEVWGYPVEQERKCRDNRKNGKKGGRVTKQLFASKEPCASPDAPPCAIPTAPILPNVKERKEREGKEKEEDKTPIIPKGDVKKDALKIRVGAIFNRKPETKWGEKENSKFNELFKRNEFEKELVELEAFYKSEYEYKRHDLITFLNNWCGELDKSKNWKPKTKLAIGQKLNNQEGQPAWNNL